MVFGAWILSATITGVNFWVPTLGAEDRGRKKKGLTRVSRMNPGALMFCVVLTALGAIAAKLGSSPLILTGVVIAVLVESRTVFY